MAENTFTPENDETELLLMSNETGQKKLGERKIIGREGTLLRNIYWPDGTPDIENEGDIGSDGLPKDPDVEDENNVEDDDSQPPSSPPAYAKRARQMGVLPCAWSIPSKLALGGRWGQKL